MLTKNTTMPAFKLHRPWEDVKEKLKEINSSLTDEDLVYQEGNEDELLQDLSKKIDMPPEEVRGLIESVSFNDGKAS